MKMKIDKIIVAAIMALLVMIVPASALMPMLPPSFTGEASVDMNGAPRPDDFLILDPGYLDVGIPIQAPPGTVSGHDMEDIRIFYDAPTDTLYVAANNFMIAGDVDGDGDPSVASSWLSVLGGYDLPDYSGTESFAFLIDMDEDGIPDTITGVSALGDISTYGTYTFSGLIILPAYAFGAPLPAQTGPLPVNPSAIWPDLEFMIPHFSSIPTTGGPDPDPLSFSIYAFQGSFSDDGIGEDFLPGAEEFYQLQLAAIGDKVWEDLDGDGIQDPGEPGIDDVTVNLYDCFDNLILTTTTAGGGMYQFIVHPGDYKVEFILPLGLEFTTQDAGADDTVDSDADPITGMTICTTLDPGEIDDTWDAGMYEPAEIGDFVWEDLNGNGIQDGEPGIPGVPVDLLKCDDTYVDSTFTDGSGYYNFIVPPGDYKLQFYLPLDYVFTVQDVGADDTVDSDADPISGMTICTQLESGETDYTWDAGMLLPPGEIIVCKWTEPWGADQLFDFETNYMDPFQLSDGMCRESGPLEPGIYSVQEVNIPEDWEIYQIYCDGKDPESIDLSPGETVVCDFLDIQLTKIIVHKTTIPAGESQIFNFDSDYAGPFDLSDGELHDSGWLPPYMSYWVQEVNIPVGWDLTDPWCVYNGYDSPPSDIYPSPGEIVHCYFENTKRGEAQGIKTINGLPPGEFDPVFTFTLQGSEVDETDTPDLGTGLVDFNDAKLIPGETYTICESTLPAGWMTNWMLDSVPVTPYNPVEGTYCYDFTVEPGEEVTFAIDNSMPPGGEPRTIGYWKNWNTCTNGNQAETAAKNGGPENGFYLVEDLLPITLGCGCELVVTECGQAVAILNMKDTSKPEKKQKSANDAAYKLAAQLLAAELNMGAGAVVCPDLQTYMADAHDLLCRIDFDGEGTYLTSKQGDPDDRAEALYLAGMLDQYNNGDLCPLPV